MRGREQLEDDGTEFWLAAACAAAQTQAAQVLPADQRQNGLRLAAQLPCGRGDVLCSSQPKQADSGVAQTGHHMRATSAADLRSIFVVGPVADIVEAVFDPPVAAVKSEKTRGVGFPCRKAGHHIRPLQDVFPALYQAAVQVSRDAVNAGNLADIGKLEVAVQRAARPNASDLDAAMPFIDRRMLRGEKPPFRRRYRRPAAVPRLLPAPQNNTRYPSAESAGCP